MRRLPLPIILCFLAILVVMPEPVPAYEFPYADPYVATVIGTPKELRAEVPAHIPVSDRDMSVYDRPVPSILWYAKKLRYSVAPQDKEAPLVFLIGGMGAGFDDPKLRFLQSALFSAGFHVVCLSSPAHPNFIVSASSSGIPGNLREDAADLYRVMELISCDIRKSVAISGYHLAGYSLGACDAAFLAELDERQHLFRFGRVLLINPPVDLYHATHVLDGMIKQIPGGEEKFEEFFDKAFLAFSTMFQSSEQVNFTGNFLFRGGKPDDKNLAALIALSFRLSVTNMVFTTDVFTNSGYIKPKNLELSTTDSLTDYFKVADRITFSDYFHDIFLPYFLKETPGLTEQRLVDQLSLKSIEEFLRASRSVYLAHNSDDLLLAPGEIDYLKDVFGSRARIYPRGGHCGNLDHRENVAYMIDVLKEGARAGEGGETAAEPPALVCPVPRPEAAEAPSFTTPHPAAAAVESTGPGAGEKVTVKIVPARRPAAKPGLSYVIDVFDPLEPVNREMSRVNATLDEYLILPVTRGYEFITPVFVQNRISDVFSNISDVRSFSNALLQLRPTLTASIFTRFLINSTIGLGGLWDPATRLGFAKHSEDFGQTLGWYGLSPGPYIVLPVLGPSSLRDTVGLAADTTAEYFYLIQPTDMNRNVEWEGAYDAGYFVDKRHNTPFRYYQTGSPFEYDLLRLLYIKKREVDIQQ